MQHPAILSHSKRVFGVVLQKSTPPQIRQLIFTITNLNIKLTNLCEN